MSSLELEFEDTGIELYEQYIADSGVWNFGSAGSVGHNGMPWTTDYNGLRFIGALLGVHG